MLNNLDTRILLVVEASVETIAEDQNIDSLPFKIILIVQFQVLCLQKGYDHETYSQQYLPFLVFHAKKIKVHFLEAETSKMFNYEYLF